MGGLPYRSELLWTGPNELTNWKKVKATTPLRSMGAIELKYACQLLHDLADAYAAGRSVVLAISRECSPGIALWNVRVPYAQVAQMLVPRAHGQRALFVRPLPLTQEIEVRGNGISVVVPVSARNPDDPAQLRAA
jgi:hypothetical protein